MTTRRSRSLFERRPAAALDANALELLARVVAAGSFAAAARKLGQTRAAVSARIAHIESAIGQPLFARSTRSLTLTDAGRSLAARARSVADAAEAARNALRSRAQAGDSLEGTLRLTSTPIFGSAVLAPLLARFQATHPALKLELSFTHRRVDLLREDVDVAFRITRHPPPDWVARPVLEFDIRAYAAPRAAPLASPADLTAERILLLGPPLLQPLSTQWQHTSGERLPLQLDPAVTGDDMGTLLAIAGSGHGVVFAPDFCAREWVERGQLIDLLPEWTLRVPDGDQVVALMLPQPASSAAARALVAYVAERLGKPAGATSPTLRPARAR